MNKKLKLVLRCLFGISLLFSLVPFAFGAWSSTGSSGDWEDNTLPSILGETGTGYLNYTYGSLGSVNDGEGVAVAVGSFVQAQGIVSEKYFYFSFQLEGSGGSVYSLTEIEDWSFPWHGSKFCFGADLYSEEWLSTGGIYSQNCTYIIEFYRIDSTHASIKYHYVVTPNVYGGIIGDYEYSDVYLEYTENVTVDSSVWTTPTLNLYMAHDGEGVAQMFINNPMTGDISTQVDTFDTIPENNSWFMAIWNSVSSIFATIIDLTVDLTPIFPLMMVCYFLDVLVTSLEIGSFQPIGAFFMTLYDALVSGASFIADAINAILPL